VRYQQESRYDPDELLRGGAPQFAIAMEKSARSLNVPWASKYHSSM
jgi:hypothetical protein